ncbi:hypothetical protein O9X81_05185 [Agrobacterium salinitolerans]|uniref:phage tail tip lysozyme n=1 Tax=Agrobacterium salinitolerans TaxID=1183413 RepID=UPI0022B818A6|nr:phage tail tip lysozyme [Agrobacterium salinitolerans]MCZ7856000.1 hypothetical protein [Agrobacterium salinitolerans]
MALKAGFLIGGDTNETPQSLARKRALIAQIMANGRAPTTIGEGLNALGDGIVANVLGRRADKAEAAGQDSANAAFAPLLSGFGESASSSGLAKEVAATSPSASPKVDASGSGNVYDDFIGGVKSAGLTNPYGLAAVAATGQAESGWSPQNANRTWSDPSQSGQAGTAGGVMSWRNERLNNLYNFARQRGEQPGSISPATQAAFFVQEDPSLIQRLNSAKSAEEAQSLMNNAWKFAGYDQPGGETARRMGLASSYVQRFQGGSGPEVASLDPSAGMSAPQAIETAAPPSGYVDPMVSAPNSKPQEMAALQGPTGNGRPFDLVSGSPQLARADTRRGILRALTGQTGPEEGATGAFPAAPSAAVATQPQAAQQAGFPTAPQAPSRSGPSVQQLIAAVNNPWLTEQQRAVATTMLEQRMQEQDPLRQLQLQKGQLELEQMRNPQPEYDIISGKDGSIFRADKKKGTVEQVYGGKPDLPTDVREYEYAKQQGFEGSFVDFQLAQKRAGASQVNIDQKAEGAFDKKLAEKQAESLDVMATEGMNARADLGVINELGTLMAGRGGTLDGVSGALAKYGIGGEGMGDIQAAQALINRLVPTQRQPGSGSMSDRDVELFTRSLPSLWNQPGGNERILNTMRGLAQYKQAQGDIAQRVMTGEISRQDATKMLRELPNPLAGFKTADVKPQLDLSKPISEMTDEELEALANGN